MPLDRKKAHQVHVDFLKGTRTFKQDGKSYTEGGTSVIVEDGARAKFPCCKCEFDTNHKDAMRHHLRDLHHVDEGVMLREIKAMDKIEPVQKKEEPKGFECPHCPSMFKKQMGLVAHLRVHKVKK